MDIIALILGIIFIILSIFRLLYKKSQKYGERKEVAIMFFVFGISWILIAFITNGKLSYLIIGLTFTIMAIWNLYLKKKKSKDIVITDIMWIGLGILWLLRAFIPD